MKYVVFSIDNVSAPRSLAKFLHHMDVQKAMGNMVGEMKMCHGSYKGQMELSFILCEADFDRHVHKGYVEGQESILVVGGYRGQYAHLEYLKSGDVEYLGPVREVSKEEAMGYDGWTYRPDMNKYFIVGE